MKKGIVMGLLSVLLRLVGCGGASAEVAVEARSEEARKQKTEAVLKQLGIPVNPHLPWVESEEEAKLQSPSAVAERCVILRVLVSVGRGGGGGDAVASLKAAGLWEKASPKEQAFFENPSPTKQDVANVTWRTEALWTLLWTLGKVEKLDLPTGPCEWDQILRLVPAPEQSAEFIQKAALRPKTEILDATDMIYRIHWAVRDAQLKKQPAPAKLNADVVIERHYGMNWITCYADEWDEVTTDT